MENTMHEITKKLHKQTIESFRPLAEYMAQNGATEDEIVSTFQNQMRIKRVKYYERIKTLGNILRPLFVDIKTTSKAEWIFNGFLSENNIPFKYQYKIGPYIADFLINNFLVLEIDGPNHNQDKDDRRDKYMEKMGYKILRIPLWIVCNSPTAIISELKQLLSGIGKDVK